MGDHVPRRMRRFYRNRDSEEIEGIELEAVPAGAGSAEKAGADSEITMQLALDEVQRFKDKHNRLPKKDEYDSIAESIYSQLRDNEERQKALERLERKRPKAYSAKRERHGRERPEGEQGEDERKEAAFEELQRAAKGLSEKEIKGMSVDDLFGAGTGKAKKKGEDEFGLTGGGREESEEEEFGRDNGDKKQDEDEFGLGELSDLGEGQQETDKQKCPKCGNETDDIIFCPECGTAFCEKCAKAPEVQGNVKTFTCPNCRQKIKRE